ncbi:MAG: hypothetical protein AB3N22_12165, partial [Ruegeria sp.]
GGTGTNVLVGGILSDAFVFDADEDGTSTVTDLEAWDTLVFDDFGYATAADIRAHLSQSGRDVVFADQGVTVILQDTLLSDISNDMLSLV